MSAATVTPQELMTAAAARILAGYGTCFAGIGLPSDAAILAQRTAAPDLFLIFESGVLGARPSYLPLSVADPALSRTALSVVGVPEIFNYWLQPGRLDVGVLGAAQIDRHAAINSTLIGGDYANPRLRLPGSGGAPEISAACREIMVIVAQSPRTFVADLDFVTTLGARSRTDLGLRGTGPRWVVTDLGIYEPDPDSGELLLTALQPGIDVAAARQATGWDLRVAAEVRTLDPPSPAELETLRSLAL
ncbi:CoA-transferase subunit beta [Phytohabitans flavus]|uniref:3-oxoadipate--succinyl-CoA transferase subunit B n=1 Tax=Phytohabitans flavus TaxID=1076124 RepID=A0A6F8XVY9_9ACTN|nr:CoA-transferase [Phytohabitans flavus]BCB77901.1 3-oxoadipate--succinyl-CoA transferase subunit B [Phytohabitans flavus]